MGTKQNKTKEIKLDFVGIGPPKSATTWLAKCVQEHPEAYIPEIKELHYFLKIPKKEGVYTYYNRPKGYKWFNSLFKNIPSNIKKGDWTPNYFANPYSPELIKENNPDMKIILVIRNPIEILISGYHYFQRGVYNRKFTFKEYFETQKESLLYYKLLKKWEKYFPKKNIHIILYENIKKSPKKVIKDLYKFIGVDPNFEPPSLHKKINARSMERWPILNKPINYLYYLYLKYARNDLTDKLLKKIQPIYEKILFIEKEDTKSIKIPKEIKDYFKQDLKKLSNHLNHDFLKWVE